MMTVDESISPVQRDLVRLVDAQRNSLARLLQAPRDVQDLLDHNDLPAALAVVLAAIQAEEETILDLLEQVWT